MAFLTKASVSQLLGGMNRLRRKLPHHDKEMLEILEELTVLLDTALVLFHNDGEKLNISTELSEIMNLISDVATEEDATSVVNEVFTKKSPESIASDIKNTVIIPLLLTLHARVKTAKFDVGDTFAVTINQLKIEMIGAVAAASSESLATLTNLKVKVDAVTAKAYSTAVQKLRVSQFVDQYFIAILDRYPNHDDVVVIPDNETWFVEKNFPSMVFPIKASDFANALKNIYGL